jgi:L-fuculose-phosphate aldolase
MIIGFQIYRTAYGSEGNEVEFPKENYVKKDIVDISQRCGAQGWCPGTLGNISLFNSKSKKVYIKRSGADLNRLKLEDILTLDLDGKVLKGQGKPSKEMGFHLGIYKVRQDARAILHVHPPFATAYAVAGKKMPMVTEAAKIILVDVPLLPSAPPGSIELATRVTDGFKDSRVKAILLGKHGVVTIGENLENAYCTTSLVEDTAKIALLSSLIKK